jgi:hypothetical protein
LINAPQLLTDLMRLLKHLEDDLRQRIAEVADLNTSLQAEWQAARYADRTAETFETWAEQAITQAGVHWLLSCVFLRFIEDNELVERPWLSGSQQSGRLALARDRHEAYFREKPLESDRDYLLACFREARALPGLHAFFDEAHNPLFRLGISGDAAMAVMKFLQMVDPNTGALVHDFTDPVWNTRFLGDLYQDLSDATRKRYALLQTPEFVEEFILDRTLTPAISEFGYREVRIIDPTCGSGHFLLGGFHRMVAEWQRAEPGRNERDVVQKALDAVAGVDLNPFAIAISRFRLLLAALQASSVRLLSEAPDFHINVAVGDSLLHGRRFSLTATEGMFESGANYAGTGLAHAYASEDLADVQRLLGRQYHAVVGNPPYIVVKDAALNAAYRKSYASCHMKYSLGAPFTERFFELAKASSGDQIAGYIGLITTNSFMTREFGVRLVEQVLPKFDLTHVVNTSGAYIPGHGTPTVIVFGRNRSPVDNCVRVVMGIKGEPEKPEDPSKGLVWASILNQIDNPGSVSAYISVSDLQRAVLSRHPWSIGGGGAAELKDLIETNSSRVLGDEIAIHRSITQFRARAVTREIREIGVFGMTNADEVMLAPRNAFDRQGVEREMTRSLVEGDLVRNWSVAPHEAVLFPYAQSGLVDLSNTPGLARWLWPCRTTLGNRATFGKETYFDEGRPWWSWHQIALRRAVGLTITFAFVATHNHFVLDRGGNAFTRTAPVFKLPEGTTEAAHLGLLGLLNSSVVCFWLKQISFNKGDSTDSSGARTTGDAAFDTYEFGAAQVAEIPLPESRPVDLGTQLDQLAQRLAGLLPAIQLAKTDEPTGLSVTRAGLDAARESVRRHHHMMIATQEELDWRCYRLYGLLPSSLEPSDLECGGIPIEVALGERAFEIVLARRLAADAEVTTWFDRNGTVPVTEIPKHWPEAYRRVVQRRIEMIEGDSNVALIERPQYKRRWNSPSWESLEQDALREWLLTRLESPQFWIANAGQPPQLSSTGRLADAARHDADFMHVAALYAGHTDFDPGQLVADLVISEAVPFLSALRYTDRGLRKRAQWDEAWALQRREDHGEDVGKIPVPPKYQSKDFLKSDFWRLRGGVDVPKERWVSYPGCERGADGSLVIAWAGWDDLQQATALAGYFVDMKNTEGWEPGRLQPLLAGLLELVPWLEQWHNEIDPVYGERMGAYYRGFVNEEARALGFTVDDLRAWKPAVTAVKRGRRKVAQHS